MPLVDLVYFQQNFSFGATEENLYDLAQNLDKNIFRVHLICPDIETLDPFAALRAERVIVHRYPSPINSGSLIRATFALRRLFKQINPKLVHFNDICIRGILAARLAGVRISIMTHHTPELNRQYSWFGYVAEKLVYLSRPYVIFTSEPDRHTGLRKDGIPATRGRVIPYGLRPIWFQSTDSLRTKVRSELGIPDTHTVVLSAGRLCVQKRHDILIEAARTVLTKANNVTFLLAGDGELRAQTEAGIVGAGIGSHFRLLGHRRDIRDLMLASDVFLMSSDFEGLCYAVLEAAASGLPTVATSVGGLPLSVADGETGILVPPGDSIALSDALEELILHPVKRRALGESARRRASRLFTLDRMVKETEACYLTLLAQHNAAR